VEADLEADNVVIQGQVTGNVLARQQLEIQSSGQLLGDCKAKSIDIREGAVFEGRSNMIRSSVSPPGPGAGASSSAPSEAKVNPK
jgi:cytoskeletal protein CcmA (bactofilin family)